jgi:predicted deacetylase
MSASYLLRFDDICPTLKWSVWHEIESILLASDIRPLLAVVPDNRDERLMVCPPDTSFWEKVRKWQARGWSIGLHGYQHIYSSSDRGLVGLLPRSEFAGLTEDKQEHQLEAAVDIFRAEGVRPDFWVAPGHSFDRTTLRLLAAKGIRVLSDGHSIMPFVDEFGVLRVPQQLWRFRGMPFGVWTVCIHFNSWSRNDIDLFRCSLLKYKRRLTSLEQVIRNHGDRCQTIADHLASLVLGFVIRARVQLGSYGEYRSTK